MSNFTLDNNDTNTDYIIDMQYDGNDSIYVVGKFSSIGNVNDVLDNINNTHITAFSIAKYNISTNDWTRIDDGESWNNTVIQITTIIYNIELSNIFISIKSNTTTYKIFCKHIDPIAPTSWIQIAEITQSDSDCKLNSMVLDLTGNLYIGGKITQIVDFNVTPNTINVNNVAHCIFNDPANIIAGYTWNSIGASGIPLGIINTLFINSGILYTGGDFTSLNNLAYISLSDLVSGTWQIYNGGFVTPSIINCITLTSEGYIMVGGTISTSAPYSIFYYNTISNQWISYGEHNTTNADITGSINSIYDDGTVIYAGGKLNNYNGIITTTKIISNWENLGSYGVLKGLINTDTIVYKIIKINTKFYFSGIFDNTNSTNLFGLGIYDGITISCLTETTNILTPNGYINITKLNIDDLIITDDNRTVPIILIKKNTQLLKNSEYPYVILKNTIDSEYPPEDISLSKFHLIKYKNKWIKPQDVEYAFQDKSKNYITYYHIQLPNFITDNLVINGGCVVESYGSRSKEDEIEWTNRFNN
jgi:hypothetical protein